MGSSTAALAGVSVLVTGASGFIGGALCRRLAGIGSRVHAVSRRPHAAENGVAWQVADLADSDVCGTLLRSTRPDLVFHLAGHVTGARDLAQVLPTFRSNLASTVNLLATAGEAPYRRIILAGSLEEPDAGETRPVPSSPYAAAKWAASTYARHLHAVFGVPVTIARLFMVYGPAQRDLTKLVPYVTLSLLRGEAPRLSSGARPVDWVFVDDVVDGLLAIALADGVDGRTLDLGSGRLVTVREVALALQRLVGTDAMPRFGDIPDRPLEQVRCADTETTREATGWRAATPLDAGLGATVDWYRRQAVGSPL